MNQPVKFCDVLTKAIDCPLLIFTDGKLDVFQHNKLLTSITVWTTFGELAILYNCTRTASVRGKQQSDSTFTFQVSDLWSFDLCWLNMTEQWVSVRPCFFGWWWKRWLLQGFNPWPCGRNDHTSCNTSLILCPISSPRWTYTGGAYWFYPFPNCVQWN